MSSSYVKVLFVCYVQYKQCSFVLNCRGVDLFQVEKFTIPPDSVKGKLDGVVDGLPPDKGCEVLDGELTHE